MSDKSLVWLGAGVGSMVGGLLPALWHASLLSLWGILLSGLGGIAGKWAAWRFINS